MAKLDELIKKAQDAKTLAELKAVIAEAEKAGLKLPPQVVYMATEAIIGR